MTKKLIVFCMPKPPNQPSTLPAPTINKMTPTVILSKSRQLLRSFELVPVRSFIIRLFFVTAYSPFTINFRF